MANRTKQQGYFLLDETTIASAENCVVIRDDSASHPDCSTKVCWNGQTELPAHSKFIVDLRFQNASIYSILI